MITLLVFSWTYMVISQTDSETPLFLLVSRSAGRKRERERDSTTTFMENRRCVGRPSRHDLVVPCWLDSSPLPSARASLRGSKHKERRRQSCCLVGSSATMTSRVPIRSTPPFSILEPRSTSLSAIGSEVGPWCRDLCERWMRVWRAWPCRIRFLGSSRGPQQTIRTRGSSVPWSESRREIYAGQSICKGKDDARRVKRVCEQ